MYRLAPRVPLLKRSGTFAVAPMNAGNSRRHARSSTWSREHAICSLHFLSPRLAYIHSRTCVHVTRAATGRNAPSAPPEWRTNTRSPGGKSAGWTKGRDTGRRTGGRDWRKNRHWYERRERYDTREGPRKTERIGGSRSIGGDACACDQFPFHTSDSYCYHHRYHHHCYYHHHQALRRGKQPREQAAKSSGAR